MIADEVQKIAPTGSIQLRDTVRFVQRSLHKAERFIFDEKVSALAMAVMKDAMHKEQLAEMAAAVVLPFDNFWLEYFDKDGLTGMYVAVADGEVVTITFSRAKGGVHIGIPSVFTKDLTSVFEVNFPEMEEAGGSSSGYDFISLVGLLTVLNAKKIVQYQPSDLAKLNRNRLAHNKPPLFEHTVVKMRHEARDSTHRGHGEKCPGKRLHHVQSFTRIKQGKLELVRHHWRGKAELGVVTHDYEV